MRKRGNVAHNKTKAGEIFTGGGKKGDEDETVSEEENVGDEQLGWFPLQLLTENRDRQKRVEVDERRRTMDGWLPSGGTSSDWNKQIEAGKG